MNIAAGVVVSAVEKAAETVIGYAADAAAGHIGYKALTKIVDECADNGAELAGDLGRTAGKVVGKVLAGNTLPVIQEEKNAIASSVRTLGTLAVDAAAKKTNKTSWMDTAWKAAKIGATGLGIVAVAAGLAPAAPVALATAAVAAAPDLIKAISKDIEPNDKPNLLDHVVIPGIKQVLFTAAGAAVGNFVRADTVINAHDNRIEQFADAGKAFGSYLPNKIAPYAEKLGRVVGQVDAGRYAMSDDMINNANSAGDLAQNAVQTGLQVGDAIIADSKPSDSWKDVARRTFWLGAGALGVGALVVMAPEVAAVTGGVAAIGVASEGVRWFKAKLLSPKKAEAVATENTPSENPMKNVREFLKPQPTEISTVGIAASAA